MKQLEIQYFWPLTEQIPLGLNYEGCEKPKLAVDTNVDTGLTYKISRRDDASVSIDNVAVSIKASHMNLDVDTTVIKLKEKPRLCRRIMLKCLGLKWEIR